MTHFIFIDCPTNKFFINSGDILFGQYFADTGLLCIKLRNGDKFELEDVMNLTDIAHLFGVPKESFRLRILDND